MDIRTSKLKLIIISILIVLICNQWEQLCVSVNISDRVGCFIQNSAGIRTDFLKYFILYCSITPFVYEFGSGFFTGLTRDVHYFIFKTFLGGTIIFFRKLFLSETSFYRKLHSFHITKTTQNCKKL